MIKVSLDSLLKEALMNKSGMMSPKPFKFLPSPWTWIGVCEKLVDIVFGSFKS